MGELHLEILVDRMKREFKVEANVGAPQVAYREYLKKPVDIDYTHKKQSGGSGQFGRVKVTVKPGERGSGYQFFDEIKGGNIPREYIPSVEKGFKETAETGSLIGFPIIDFEVHLPMVRITMSTPARWHSKSVRAVRCVKRPRRPGSRCSSRS